MTVLLSSLSLAVVAACLLILPTGNAFVVQPQQTTVRPSTMSLKATASGDDRSPSWSAAVATAMVGWTLATQVACANIYIVPTPPNDLTSSSSITLAAGAYIPEESYGTLDLKMPSYTLEKDEAVTIDKDEDPAKAEKRAERERAAKEKAEQIAQQKAKKAQLQAQAAAAKAQAQAEKEAAKEQAKADAVVARAAKIEAMKDEKMRAFAQAQEAKRQQDEAEGNKPSVMDNMKRMYGLD